MDSANINGLYSRFKDKAEAVEAQVFRVPTAHEAGELISGVLAEFGAKRVVLSLSALSHQVRLDEILENRGFQVSTSNLRAEAPEADAGISQLDIAVAETGTLVHNTTDADSRLVSALPLLHIALVPARGLVATLEEAMANLQGNGIPAYISFITGPSRTSDIERVLTIGVPGKKLIRVTILPPSGTR